MVGAASVSFLRLRFCAAMEERQHKVDFMISGVKCAYFVSFDEGMVIYPSVRRHP